jgi:TonB family protein
MESEMTTGREIILDKFNRGLLFGSIVFSLLSNPVRAVQPAAVRSARTLYLQDSVAGTSLGKLNVPTEKMAGRCITMVSPNYPQNAGNPASAASVVVRVVIWKSGSVSPLRVISGPPLLEGEAMNAVRLWRYKPYSRDGEALDVTTDIRVDFDPAKPGGTVTHPHN